MNNNNNFPQPFNNHFNRRNDHISNRNNHNRIRHKEILIIVTEIVKIDFISVTIGNNKIKILHILTEILVVIQGNDIIEMSNR